MGKTARKFAAINRLMGKAWDGFARPLRNQRGILQLTEEQAKPVVVADYGKPTTVPELQGVVEQIRSNLVALSTQSGINASAHIEAAKDLKAATESLEKIKADAAQALELARNAEALAKNGARQIGGLTDSAIKSIPFLYDIKATRGAIGAIDPMAYNLLSFSRDDREQCDEVVAKLIDRVQRLWCGIAVLDHYYKKNGNADVYLRAGGWESLPQAKEFKALEERIKAVAMDTAESQGGSQWVPTGVLPILLPDLRPEFAMVSGFPSIGIPRSPITLPVQGDHFRAAKVAENTASTGQTQIATANLQTLNITFDTPEIMAMTVYSTKLEDDSIVMLATVVPADLRTAILASRESASVNGQLTGAIDTGDSPTGTDDRLLWDGVRYHQTLTGVSQDGGAGLTWELMTLLKGSLRKWGKNPSEGAWLTGYIGWAKCLALKDAAGTAVYTTMEKAGALATALTGALGMVGGSPLYVSDYYPENMNASGIVDGAGTKTGIHYYNRMTYRMGDQKLTRIDQSTDQFFQFAQVAYRVIARCQLKPVRTPSATYLNCGAILNL